MLIQRMLSQHTLVSNQQYTKESELSLSVTSLVMATKSIESIQSQYSVQQNLV